MKGFRTLLFNLGAAIIPVLQATNIVDFGITGTGAEIYAFVISAANIALRAITTTPIGTK